MADRGDGSGRLDLAVMRHAATLHRLSRAKVQQLVSLGRVRVNGVGARRAAQRLRVGDVVHVDVDRPAPRTPPGPERLPLAVVFEDDDLIVIDKPPGMVVHPSFRHSQGTLVNALLFHAGTSGRDEPPWQPRLVQRLDKGTSGLLVVAKSAEVHTALQDDAAAFTKEYLALVWGRPVPSSGRIAVRLGRDPLDRRRVMAVESGAAAITEYRTISRARGTARGLSLLCCRLVTGRTHQLRVHLAERGWPLVGEPTYGHRPSKRLDDPIVDRAVRAFSRQALHAWRLGFRHPRSGQQMAFAAPPADDMSRLLGVAGLRGWS